MPSSERHEAAIALAYARTAGTLAPVDRRSFTMGYKAALADAARAEAAEQEEIAPGVRVPYAPPDPPGLQDGGEREAMVAPAGQEHPSWSRHAYLCGACGEVSYADDWLAFKHDDDCGLTPAEDGDNDPIIRCPICKTDHKDADDDTGVWAGTRKEMYAERDTQLQNPIIADAWIGFWKGRAEHPHQDVERPIARNGEPCDCETPGDWHRVAADFQQAMFTERARAEAAEQELDRLKRVIEVERESAEAETTRAIEAARVVVDLRQELERLDNVLRVAEDGLTYIAAHGSEASGRYAAKVSGEMAAQRTRNRLASPPDEGAR